MRVLCEGAKPAAGMKEAVESAMSAFGIDQACDEGRVVEFEPLWAEAGIRVKRVKCK